jgi:hypothetical protein
MKSETIKLLLVWHRCSINFQNKCVQHYTFCPFENMLLAWTEKAFIEMGYKPKIRND